MPSADISNVASLVRSVKVTPRLDAKIYKLSPLDISQTGRPNCCPLFYRYHIDGDSFLSAFEKFLIKYPILCGRLKSDVDTRWVIEVDPEWKGYGVTFKEFKTEISVAEAILHHARFEFRSSEFPKYPDVPYFMDIGNNDAVLRGEEGVTLVRLTHFKDGCCIALTVQHVVSDGFSYLNAMVQLSCIYRGMDVPDPSMDRSILWPDRLRERFPEWMRDDRLPRIVHPTQQTFPHLSFPGASSQIRSIHFSEEVIDRMKEKVKPYLKNGIFVSTNDLLCAFVWLLESELVADHHPIRSGIDLDLPGTHIVLVVGIPSGDIDLLPDRYFGNVSLRLPVRLEDPTIVDASLIVTLARLAVLIRNKLDALRTRPEWIVENIMDEYRSLVCGKSPQSWPVDRWRGCMTTVVKAPFDRIDFGKGGTMHALIGTFPVVYPLRPMGPGLGYDGVLMQMTLLDGRYQKFKDSVVVKECAEGIRDVFETYSVEELKKKLGLLDDCT